MKNFIFSTVVIIFITAIVGLAANAGAYYYLLKNPEILKAEGEALNEIFHQRSLEFAKHDKELLEWYDVDSIDSLIQLFDELSQNPLAYDPYVMWRHKSGNGRFYSIHEAGFRNNRISGPWPVDADNYNIFFFGGSTAHGMTTDDSTVASYLQDVLNERLGGDRKVYEYNFGRSSYQSTQEMLLFQRLLSGGHIPDSAIFLDGLNDFCYLDGKPSGWQTLDYLYTDYQDKYRRRAVGPSISMRWDSAMEFIKSAPLYHLAEALVRSERVNQRAVQVGEEIIAQDYVIGEHDDVPKAGQLDAVAARYLNNIRQIKAISDEFDIMPVFVWQPIPTYKYDITYHAFLPRKFGCQIGSYYGYPIVYEKIANLPVGENFIWAADIQEGVKKNLYVDAVHYTSEMSKMIADYIAENMITRGLTFAR